MSDPQATGPARPSELRALIDRAFDYRGYVTLSRRDGDKLVATAREISRSGRSGIYDVRVTVGETVVAEFRGHSRTIPGTWLPVADTEKK